MKTPINRVLADKLIALAECEKQQQCDSKYTTTLLWAGYISAWKSVQSACNPGSFQLLCHQLCEQLDRVNKLVKHIQRVNCKSQGVVIPVIKSPSEFSHSQNACIEGLTNMNGQSCASIAESLPEAIEAEVCELEMQGFAYVRELVDPLVCGVEERYRAAMC